ncbi:S-layer homology domain-containing protein [Paenibacillus timonensis]|uniref:S-layer homology domain-containing protein n=1 Tax=Paenibacillus timonensis TaxID=225915 RepID=UPI003F9DB665
MKQSIIKVAISTTLTVGLAVSAVAPVSPVMAEASSGISWLDVNDTLTRFSMPEDDSINSGKTIEELLIGKVSAPGATGVSVLSLDQDSKGTWQYWVSGENQWRPITANFLLRATDLIRFKPNLNWNGTAAFTYQLWDMSLGEDTTSPETGTMEVEVTPENDTPYLTESSGGYYLGMDGNGGYVEIPDPNIYGGSFTVEGFLKVDGFNTWMRFFESSNGVAVDNVFIGFNGRQMNFSTYSPESEVLSNITTEDVFPMSQWVHTAFVYDDTTKQGSIYWNGTLKAQGYADMSQIGPVHREYSWLGKSSWSSDGYYMGGMKDVRFWNKAKTQQQIVDEMNTDLTGNEPGLVANYKLNDNSLENIAFSTPSGRTGDIINGTWLQSEGFIGATTMAKNTPKTRYFKAIDPDLGDVVEIVATSSDQALVPNANLTVVGTGENRGIQIVPAANAYGTTRITVQLEDGIETRQYSFDVIVTNTARVSEVTLDAEHLDLTLDGPGATLHATVMPADAVDPTVIWSSSNEAVVRVDEYGFVTPVGPGNAVITVTTVDGSYTATTTVNVAGLPGVPTDVTAIPGDGEATVTFTPPVNNGGSPITGYTVIAQPGGKTATGTGSPIRITGLDNGVDYTFTVVASNRAGQSDISPPSGSVTPMPPAPGAPLLQQPIIGNGQVTLAWHGVDGADGYKVYQSDTPDGMYTEIATVTGSVYDYTISGLTNGTTYYFLTKAVSYGQEGAPSLPVSATPITVPDAPTNISAISGNGQATISFTPPAQQGGSPITGYEVIASPGGIRATGSSSPITITGLINGTSYTFTVIALNQAGGSGSSTESNAVTPVRPDGGSSGGGGSVSTPVTVTPSESPVPAAPTAPVAPKPAGVNVYVNGKSESAGTAISSKREEQTVTTISIDQKKLEEKLATEGQHAVVAIQSASEANVVVGELNGRMVKNMENQAAILEIVTGQATYTLPAKQINIDAISGKLGQSVALDDIKVQVEIGETAATMAQVVKNAATHVGFTLTVPPIDFTVKGIYGEKTVEVSKFNAYVERLVALPEGIDPSKITTGVVVQPDGKVRHVPTKVVVMDGKYYAKINSLTNSTYSVVWHPLEFSDVSQHWAKDAVNDMGSRMVVDGFGDQRFNPNQIITRAEFAAIIVRGLGLEMEKEGKEFPDVAPTAWYDSAVKTAYAHQLIEGFEDGSFRPNEQITREQAMAIIAKAMVITELQAKQSGEDGGAGLQTFQDAATASRWAVDSIEACLDAGVVTGRSMKELAPKASITRAEVAAIVQRLLQKSELI